jgi:hypothetical protein
MVDDLSNVSQNVTKACASAASNNRRSKRHSKYDWDTPFEYIVLLHG